MAGLREEIIQGMKDMADQIEMKGFLGTFESNREALTSGYVLGMLQSNIQMLEGLDPEKAAEVEILIGQIAQAVKMMKPEKES